MIIRVKGTCVEGRVSVIFFSDIEKKTFMVWVSLYIVIDGVEIWGGNEPKINVFILFVYIFTLSIFLFSLYGSRRKALSQVTRIKFFWTFSRYLFLFLLLLLPWTRGKRKGETYHEPKMICYICFEIHKDYLFVNSRKRIIFTWSYLLYFLFLFRWGWSVPADSRLF